MDDDERMEEYISRPSRPGEPSLTGVPARQVNWAEGVFHGVPMTNVVNSARRYILEDGTVCDEPEGSMTPTEINQFRKD